MQLQWTINGRSPFNPVPQTHLSTVEQGNMAAGMRIVLGVLFMVSLCSMAQSKGIYKTRKDLELVQSCVIDG